MDLMSALGMPDGDQTVAPDRYQSNALWPPGVCSTKYGDNISTDTHQTKGQAEGVCEGLEREGFGGERKAFPVLTWVSDIQDPPRLPAGYTPAKG